MLDMIVVLALVWVPRMGQDFATEDRSSAVVLPLAVGLTTDAENPALEGRRSRVALPALPAFKEPADTAEVIRDSYEFAALNHEIVRYMPCYCACSKRFGHRSLEDCFIKSRSPRPADVVWNEHGGECYICLTVAMEVRRLALEGLDVRAIRKAIDDKFAHTFKYRTDTPEPPSSEALH